MHQIYENIAQPGNEKLNAFLIVTMVVILSSLQPDGFSLQKNSC